MSKLIKPYELSVWSDQWEDGKFKEVKDYIIGTDTMTSPSRAVNPKLVEKTNGDYTFTFTMYYRYQDPMTGEWVDNPFTGNIFNETKLKLHYDEKWYDMLVKSIAEDSTNKTFSYTATSQHVNELSKNGFSVTLDDKLNNSLGTAQELMGRVLEGSDWKVGAVEKFVQTLEESLVPISLNGVKAKQIQGRNGTTGISLSEEKTLEGAALALYSCCQSKENYFQFYYNESLDFNKDDDRIITDECLYVIERPAYFKNLPEGITFSDGTAKTDELIINEEYRGEKVVFSPVQRYFPLLDTYITEYEKGGKIYYAYDDIEITTPNLIQDFITNGDFRSGESGWSTTVGLTSKQNEDKNYDKVNYCPEIESIAVREVSDNNESIFYTLAQDYFSGEYDEKKTYSPAMIVDFKGTSADLTDGLNSSTPYGILINSGLYDSRTNLFKITDGAHFTLEYEYVPVFLNLANEEIVNYETKFRGMPYYDPLHLFVVSYDNIEGATATGFDTTLSGQNIEWTPRIIAETDLEFDQTTKSLQFNLGQVSEDWFKKSHIRIFIVPKKANQYGHGERVIFKKFKLYPTILDESGKQITPDSQQVKATVKTIKTLFDPMLDGNGLTTYSSKEEIAPISRAETVPAEYVMKYNTSGEAVRNVKAKESNYFNILQTIAETFQGWLTLDVEHDEEGRIESKSVVLRNYVGENNYAGFRYGVNLKDIKRTIDSKQVVTKMLVKQNSNKHGINGFCSITRASANPLRDNALYDFTYYINKGLMHENAYKDFFYGKGSEKGYITNMYNIGNELLTVTEGRDNLLIPQTQNEADITVQENIIEAAIAKLEEKEKEFVTLAGFSYNDLYVEVEGAKKDRATIVKESSDLSKKAIEILELRTQKSEAEKKLGAEDGSTEGTLYWTRKNIASELANLNNDINTKTLEKIAQQKSLQEKFGRFIQEGTWISENYFDDNKYFADAQSTLYNSSMPKVSYTINVMELSSLPGFELFKFGLGDNTFIEDPEFFGYCEDGSAYREEIVITETTKNLDEPNKDTIKVQNYKTQFQDLFQRITATTQQVKYSEGSYDKAAALADSSAADKVKFLQDGLQDASNVLQNAGEQSVTWDTRGITVTDKQSPANQLRLVGGAILMREMGEDGVERWATALTNKGISASHIRSGQLDTSVLQIMSGDQPTFRWDSYGLTAYDFNLVPGVGGDIITAINPDKGVRFDRFGIYGFNKTNGANWRPESAAEVERDSLFSTTWDGFKFRLANGKYVGIPNGSNLRYTDLKLASCFAKLGKVDDRIYNDWDELGIPNWNPASSGKRFTKLFTVGDGENDNNQNLVIYSDGTVAVNDLRVVNSIQWSSTASPVRQVFARTKLLKPADKTFLNSFEDTSETKWHKTLDSANDYYYCQTFDGGYTWSEVMTLQGKDGAPGSDGVGFEGIKEFFAATKDKTAPSKNSGVWIENAIPTDYSQDKPYLWNYEIIVKSNGEDSNEPKLLAVWGKNGEKGDTGRGIVDVITYYAISDSIVTVPDGEPIAQGDTITIPSGSNWSTTKPDSVSKGQTLWEKEFIEYDKPDANGNYYTTIPASVLYYNAKDGNNGNSLIVKYKNDSQKPEKPGDLAATGWYDTIPTVESGKRTYMVQRMSNVSTWSEPLQLSAEDGTSPEVTINDEGYWVINGEPTTTKAVGEDGEPGEPGVTPTVEIIDGKWVINGSNTEVNATGPAGKDGANIEYIYYLVEDKDESAPTTPTAVGGRWTNSPTGISADRPREYVSIRTKATGEKGWSSYSTPVVWSSWGEKGQDGDGVSYSYCRSKDGTVPTYPNPQNSEKVDDTWSDNPRGVDETWKYEYVVQLKTNNPTSSASGVLWAKWSKDGENGNGIKSSVTEYGVTKDNNRPTTWKSYDVAIAKWTADMPYFWSKTTTSYDKTEASITYSVSRWGEQGIPGPTGKGISKTIEYYCLTETNTLPENPDWDTEIKSPTEGEPYLWNYEEVYFDDNTKAHTTTPVIIAYFTKDGKGIQNIEEFYYVSDSSNQPGNVEWKPSISEAGNTSTEKPYLWNKEVITYTEGEPSVFYTIIGTHGAKGEGVTITSKQYAVNNSLTSTPAVWDTNYPSEISEGKVLWTKITYSDGNEVLTSTKSGATPPKNEPVIAYYYSFRSAAPSKPSNPSSVGGQYNQWSLSPTKPEEWEYGYKSTGVKTTIPDEFGNYDNGETIYGDWQEVEFFLIKTPSGMENISDENYTAYYKATNGGSEGIYPDKTTGKLYINANYINTGTLTVSDADSNTILSATVKDDKGVGSVILGGWKATKDTLEATSALVGMHSGSEKYVSAINGNPNSAIRFYAGVVKETEETKYKITHINPNNQNNLIVDPGATFDFLDITTTSDIPVSDLYIITVYNKYSPTGGPFTYYYISNKMEKLGEHEYRAYFEKPQLDGFYAFYYNGGLDYNECFIQLQTAKKQNAYFKVLEDGSLYASAANISGTIAANGGKIGGWHIINDGSLLSENDDVQLFSVDQNSGTTINNSDSLKTWRLKAGKNFGVTKEGYLYATNVNLTGTIVAENGDIAGWKIDKGSLTYGKFGEDNSFHMYSKPNVVYNKDYRLHIGGKFSVLNDGTLNTANIVATAGQIGDFAFDKIGLKLITSQYGEVLKGPKSDFNLSTLFGIEMGRNSTSVSGYGSQIPFYKYFSSIPDWSEVQMSIVNSKCQLETTLTFSNITEITRSNIIIFNNIDTESVNETYKKLYDDLYPSSTTSPLSSLVAENILVGGNKVSKAYVKIIQNNQQLTFQLKLTVDSNSYPANQDIIEIVWPLISSLHAYGTMFDLFGNAYFNRGIYVGSRKGITTSSPVTVGGITGYFKNGIFVEA